MTSLYDDTNLIGPDYKPRCIIELEKIDNNVSGASLRDSLPLKNYPLSITQSVHLFNKIKDGV